MEIKPREILASIIIAMITLAVGLALHSGIQNGLTETAEIYATATVIQEPDQLRYGMATDFGSVLLYGAVTSDESVTFEEIGGGFLYIRKVKEEYTKHTRTWKDSEGKKHKETYWTWDYASSENKNVKSIMFLECSFPYGFFDIPAGRLDLSAAGVSNRGNYIYCGSKVRYYYQATENGITGTLLADLHEKAMIPKSALYADKTPQEVIAGKQGAGMGIAMLFWVLWVVLIAGIVYGFCCLENRWLD